MSVLLRARSGTQAGTSSASSGATEEAAVGAGKGESEKWDVKGMQLANAAGVGAQARPGAPQRLRQSQC